MGSSSGSERTPLGARLPKELIERLRRSAEGNGRSIGYELEIAVQEYLDRQNSDPQLPEELKRAVEEYLAAHGG